MSRLEVSKIILRVVTMLLTLRLLAVPSLLLHVQGVDEEAKEWTGGGLESTIREAFRGGVASVSQFMKKFNPNEKDFEFGHRANNIYLPPAPSKLAWNDARFGVIIPSCILLFSNSVSRWSEIGADDPGRERQQPCKE